MEKNLKTAPFSLHKKTKNSSENKSKLLKYSFVPRFLLLVIYSLVFIALVLVGKNIVTKTQAGYYLGLFRNFVFYNTDSVKSSDRSVNILVLGKGGTGHEAPDLTDTIILVSISYQKPGLTLISIPRDIWIPELRAKLNSIYYWGNRKTPGGGIDLAKVAVNEVTGLPVHYVAIVDFSGLKKIVDILGGIEVNVRNSFVDPKYPIAGRENDLCDGGPELLCRYERIEFKNGLQLMDGETVLKFVRSRNSEGDEGTDFARAARQQDVLDAINRKLTGKEILFNIRKAFALKDAVLELIETDISSDEAAIVSRLVVNARKSLERHVLPETLIENPPHLPKYDNLYVLIPKKVDPNNPANRSWDDIREWTFCVVYKKEGCGSI